MNEEVLNLEKNGRNEINKEKRISNEETMKKEGSRERKKGKKERIKE